MAKYSDVVENYFQTAIKKSWTWEKLTPEEKSRFVRMSHFDDIRGTEKMRVDWLQSMYHCFLLGCGYTPIGWRPTEDEPLF